MCSQLLGELLLDRHNFTIMTKYISKPENLKLMMNLLRDKSRNIQFEAFHVFKVGYTAKQCSPSELFITVPKDCLITVTNVVLSSVSRQTLGPGNGRAVWTGD